MFAELCITIAVALSTAGNVVGGTVLTCPPLALPVPWIQLISPSSGTSGVPYKNASVTLGMDFSAESYENSFWTWVSVELIPERYEVVIGRRPTIVDKQSMRTLSSHFDPHLRSAAQFAFGTLRPGMNYRIVVDVVTPGGEKDCPSIHHPGVVGDFTTAPAS